MELVSFLLQSGLSRKPSRDTAAKISGGAVTTKPVTNGKLTMTSTAAIVAPQGKLKDMREVSVDRCILSITARS